MLAELVLVGSLLVVDGDSLLLGNERIRVVGVDAAELSCRCPAECDLATRAHDFTRRTVAGARAIDIDRQGVDRYGRTLARITVDGKDLAGLLIAAGLGRPYNGERRQSWCG